MKNNELHHFGKKGMKWGVRNVIQRIGDGHRARKQVKQLVHETMRDKNTKNVINSYKKQNRTSFLHNFLRYNLKTAIMIRRAENPKRAIKKITKMMAKEMVKAGRGKSHGIKWSHTKDNDLVSFDYNKNRKVDVKKKGEKAAKAFRDEEIREQQNTIRKLARSNGLKVKKKK